MNLPNTTKQRLKTQYGEWAIVSGASSGIGLELATQLATAGFNLIINARNEERLLKVTQQLKSHNIEVKSVVADLSDKEGVEKIIQAAQGLKVGLLINNAGYATSGLFVDASLDSEINLLRVNCEAVLALTHFFCPKIQATGEGRNHFSELSGRISRRTLCRQLCRIQSLYSVIRGSPSR